MRTQTFSTRLSDIVVSFAFSLRYYRHSNDEDKGVSGVHTVYIACQRHLGESPWALPMFWFYGWSLDFLGMFCVGTVFLRFMIASLKRGGRLGRVIVVVVVEKL